MRIALVLVALALLAGCGEDDEPPAAQPASLADLTVVVDPDGKDPQPPETTEIRCEAPEDSATCRKLAGLPGGAFEPTAPNTACTQLYGGPQTARVTGTLRGERIDASFSRANGCEIARWEAAKAVLGKSKWQPGG